MADILLQKELIDKGYLEKRFSNTRFPVTSNQGMKNGGYTMESYYNSPIQTEENKEILRKLKEEKPYDILYTLSDSGAQTDHSSSLSGLALAAILQSKGKLRDITEGYPKTYDWSIADWAVGERNAMYPNRDYKSVNETPTDQNTLLSEFLIHNN